MVELRKYRFKIDKLLLILPFLFYGFILFKYNLNFPRGDDIDQILLFVKKASQVSSFWEQIKLTFEPQATGHIIATQKIITLLVYKIFGSISIKCFIILGNLCYLSIFLILYKFIAHKSTINILMLSFCMIIPFNLLINWAGTSLNQGLLLLFAFLSFYYFYKEKLIVSFLMATLALCSLGNGLAVYASIILIMILKLLFIEKDKRKIITTTFFGLGFLVMLLIYSSLLSEKGINFSLFKSIQFIPCFIGGFAKSLITANGSLVVSGITGLFIICFLLYLLFFKTAFFFKNSFLISCLFFLIITAALASFKRPLETSITVRYQWYHSLSLALTLILTLNYLWANKIKNGIIYLIPFLSISFWDRLQDNYTNIVQHNIELKKSLVGYYLEDIELMPYPSEKAKKGVFDVIRFAENSGFYSPPPLESLQFDTNKKKIRRNLPFTNDKYQTKVVLNQFTADHLFIELEIMSLSKEVFNRNTPVFIEIEDKSISTYFIAKSALKEDGPLASTYSFIRKLDRKVLNMDAAFKLSNNKQKNELDFEIYLVITKGHKNQFFDRIKLPAPTKR